ncbi:hypothetical protein D3C71_2011470 [compost metagenome]
MRTSITGARRTPPSSLDESSDASANVSANVAANNASAGSGVSRTMSASRSPCSRSIFTSTSLSSNAATRLSNKVL